MASFRGKSSVAAALVIGLALCWPAGGVLAQEVAPVVWKGSGKTWLRDPSVFPTDSGSYILSGTNTTIIEYPGVAPGQFNADAGTAYNLRIFSPNGERNLRKDGFNDWEKNFFRTEDGVVMIASLPPADNFDTDRPKKGRRGVYVFVPRGEGRTTEGGFPLNWQLRDNTPLVSGTYNGDIYAADGAYYLFIDKRQDIKGDDDPTTCVVSQQMSPDLVVTGEPEILLCPGERVQPGADLTGWERIDPMPSEERLGNDGGLIEGAWGYDSPGGAHLVLYSAGAYKSESNYGGFVAVCATPMGACSKVMEPDGQDARTFIAPSSRNYTHIGRPFPVLDSEGQLVDIVFHARQRGSKEQDGEAVNDILRCTNFTPDILENFIAGGPACAFDDIEG